jgi:hypothetical protein
VWAARSSTTREKSILTWWFSDGYSQQWLNRPLVFTRRVVSTRWDVHFDWGLFATRPTAATRAAATGGGGGAFAVLRAHDEMAYVTVVRAQPALRLWRTPHRASGKKKVVSQLYFLKKEKKRRDQSLSHPRAPSRRELSAQVLPRGARDERARPARLGGVRLARPAGRAAARASPSPLVDQNATRVVGG